MAKVKCELNNLPLLSASVIVAVFSSFVRLKQEPLDSVKLQSSPYVTLDL